MEVNGELISQPVTIAEHFNDFFVSIGTRLYNLVPCSLPICQANGPEFSFDEIQIESVANQLKKNKSKKGSWFR